METFTILNQMDQDRGGEVSAAMLFWREHLIHWLSSPEAETFIQKAIHQVREESHPLDPHERADSTSTSDRLKRALIERVPVS